MTEATQMVANHKSLAAALLLVLSALFMAGCTSLGTLSDGRRTTMGEANIAARSALVVSTEPFRGPLRYQPVTRCDYVRVQTMPGTGAMEMRSEFSVRPVRDRLLLTMTGPLGDSTALIGPDGELFDFNVVDIETGRRSTSETYRRDAEAMLGRLAGMPGAYVVNELQIFIPHYRSSALRYGDVAAVVRTQVGTVWGQYIYAGTSSFAGQPVIILDLMRTMETAPEYGPVVSGFTLVDPSNMLPVLSSLESGFRFRLQRTGCVR